MTRLRHILIATTIVVLTAAIAAQTSAQPSAQHPSIFQNDSLRTAILTGIRMTINDEFAGAESLFVAVSESFPLSPAGPLFAAAAIHAQMLDEESPTRRPEFDRWLAECTQRTDAWQLATPEDAEPEFVRGAALGYDAVFEARWGGWFAALKKGLRSKKRFEAALQRDTTLADACLGLGNYNYWKSVRLDFITWLPFVGDAREEGLEQLERATREGVFATAAAHASLGWALIHEGRFDDALAHADTLISLYPSGKGPLWIKAYALYGLNRWAEARAVYDEIEGRILLIGTGNYYNLIDCAYYRALSYFGEGQWRNAMAECHRGLSYPVAEDIRRRQDSKLYAMRRMQRNLKEATTQAGSDTASVPVSDTGSVKGTE